MIFAYLSCVSLVALVAFVAWCIGDTCGFARGLKRGADIQRVADIEEQWRAKDRRNQCGRFRHMRTGRN